MFANLLDDRLEFTLQIEDPVLAVEPVELSGIDTKVSLTKPTTFTVDQVV